MIAWSNRHPNLVVALWWWVIPMMFSPLLLISGDIGDFWLTVFGVVWICGLLFACCRCLIVKRRSLSHIFWLLLGGLGVIIVLCLKSDTNK